MTFQYKIRIWTVAAVLWVFIIFTTQYFSQVPGTQPAFQADSDSLVTEKIRADLSIGDELDQFGGFLHYMHSAYIGIGGDTDAVPYLSQVGFQGTVFHFVYQLLRSVVSPDAYLAVMRGANALILVGLIFLITFHVMGEWGLLPIAVAIFLTIFFAWITYFSTSLYWIIWSHFLPFGLAFVLYPQVLKNKLSFSVFCTIIGALVLFKSLSGYEYITNVIAAPTVPLVYYGLRQKMSLQGIALRVLAVGIAGTAGFAAAVGVHLLQGYLYFGSLQRIFDQITARASVRMFGEIPDVCFQGNIVGMTSRYMLVPFLPKGIISPLIILHIAALLQIGLAFLSPTRLPRLMNLLRSRVAQIAVLEAIVIVIVVVIIRYVMIDGEQIVGLSITFGGSITLVAAAFMLNRRTARYADNSHREALRTLALTTAYSIPVSWTWLVLAPGHMACHFHINPIIFFMPFGLVFTYLTALTLTRLSQPLSSRHDAAP